MMMWKQNVDLVVSYQAIIRQNDTRIIEYVTTAQLKQSQKGLKYFLSD